MNPSHWGVLLLAHGTVEDPADLPAFLQRVRRGRPASPELVLEMEHRYAAISGSPLLSITEGQARALSQHTGLPCRVAMRLWAPEVKDVVSEMIASGIDGLCLLPMAPFSVPIYVSAAEGEIDVLPRRAALKRIAAVQPYGEAEGFVQYQAKRVTEVLTRSEGEHVILTAHSLPTAVIRAGDAYATGFEASARAIGERLNAPWSLAYQSQGADGGDWLGPPLLDVMTQKAKEGARRVVVAPVGFVAEHVETLYDLDIEAKRQAQELGIDFARAPAPETAPEFVELLAGLVDAALSQQGAGA